MKPRRLAIYVAAVCFVTAAAWLAVAWSGWPGGVVSGSQPKADDVEQLRLRASLGEKGSPVASLAFDPDGKTLASGHDDGTIKLWDVANGKVIKTLEGHTAVVTSVAFSRDGKTLASGSLDRTIKLWDVTGGKDTATLEGHKGGVTSVSFNPTENMLASGSHDRTIKLWDVTTRKAVKTLEGHTDVVTCVAFRRDGKTLASGSRDLTVKLWDVATGKDDTTLTWDMKESFAPNYQGVACLVFSPDGKTLASKAEHSWVMHWDLASGKLIGWNAAHFTRVNALAFNRDGTMLGSCCIEDGASIKLWDMTDVGKRKTGGGGVPSLACVWQEPLDGFTYAAAIAFSPDGKTLVSGGGRDGKLKIWDVASRKPAGDK